MSSKARRLSVLEAARREWEAAHVPLSELRSYVLGLLEIVSQEAGPQTAERIVDRLLSETSARVTQCHTARS
ncbi:hypothetical protein [Deinococcus sp.]|uniref:hypothetical protein n=1 Tax=Deinococcus sp. TaxID=47478 RepID=UPI0025E22A88|nr:hypothetical protein [Deinococcus sp.]